MLPPVPKRKVKVEIELSEEANLLISETGQTPAEWIQNEIDKAINEPTENLKSEENVPNNKNVNNQKKENNETIN